MLKVRPTHPRHPNGWKTCYLLVALLSLLGCASSASSAAASAPKSGSLLVDDFEDRNLESAVGLSWIIVADDQMGGNSKVHLSIARPGANGSRAALRITGNVAQGFQFPFAGVWALTRPDGRPNDLSAYRGIRFYARGPKGSYLAGLRHIQARQGISFVASFEVQPEWTRVEIPFDKLQRYPPTGPAVEFTAKNTLMVGISTAGRFQGEFQVEIDQVELYS